MIASIIGLQTAIATRHNASYALGFGNAFTKAGALQRAQAMTMYQIASAQEDYYRKMLSKNIKRSFSILA